MSFDKFPLDEQRCMFRVGSYSYDSSKMVFITKKYGYSSKQSNSIALDYEISEYYIQAIKLNFDNKYSCLEIEPLKDEDTVLDYGSLGNFSLSGFEMVLTRYVSTYIITYYLPSGKMKGIKLPYFYE